MIKRGFTLAEVLITLTIIGVIAAITIPNLMQSYKKRELITQIRSAQSILTNAVSKAIAENGEFDYVDDSNDRTFTSVVSHILPQLKIVKNCKMRTFFEFGCGSSGGCDVGCFGAVDRASNGFVYSTDGSKTINLTYSYTVKLANGMDASFRVTGKYIYILIDVNGEIGPRKLGVDVHGFLYNMETKKWSTGASYTMAIYPNLKAETIYERNYCPDNDLNGSCTRILELNGWQFPDNYPVKKF